jgi:transforming growth factor-beta-induced protein
MTLTPSESLLHLRRPPTVDYVCDEPDLSTLCDAIQIADLVEVLDDTTANTTYTVFAPNNAAFEELTPEFLDGLLSSVDLLTKVLLYHVVPNEEIYAADLVCNGLLSMAFEGRTTRTICEGTAPVVQKGAGNQDENLSQFVTVDIEACNGVIHVIDSVLLF